MMVTPHPLSRRIFWAFLVLGTVLSVACSPRHPVSLPARTDTPMRIDGTLEFVRFDDSVVSSITIEIADTPETQRKGLMGRRSLDPTHGMLFVFESIKPQKFLMKNTPISLDIIFVGENGCVVNISECTTPLSDKIYRSQGPIKYVVEVKAGFAKYFKIEQGICIRWRRQRRQ
ncbi:MAG: DUF192 domain-containing protein [Desulfobacterales bacterium]